MNDSVYHADMLSSRRFLVPTIEELIQTYESQTVDQNMEALECPLEDEALLLEEDDE
jgi:hypothetical protein